MTDKEILLRKKVSNYYIILIGILGWALLYTPFLLSLFRRSQSYSSDGSEIGWRIQIKHTKA
ncbi:hypothetical protein [Mesobacillus boroniphilus]|uniref:hypothetical protein n=1 Tax=Mesobacillus boroniphilus TaxID=308892 RepID=UPI00054F773C|nr:hypothetical protein [Mesobacillus boroniphilus]